MLAWSLTGLALAMLAAALVLLGLNVSRPNASRLDAALIGFYGLLAVGALTCAGAGGLIARRVRGNAIGWLLSLAGLCLTVDMLTEQYALYGLATNPGAIPAAKVAGVLSDAAVGLTVILLFALVLLFPDGRLPSAGWRWAMGAYLAVVAVLVAAGNGATVAVIAAHDVRVDSTGGLAAVDDPSGPTAWLSTVMVLVFPVLVAFWLLFAGRLVVSWRRAARAPGRERRQQLKWLMTGALAALGAGAVNTIISALDPHASAAVQAVTGLLNDVGLAAFAVCVGMAILRYRLYDIDRIISRTLAYAIVTGLLIGVYAGLVLLATEVLRFRTPVAVAASTLAAAALFTPLRSRVQRRIDRRFNRARYDADQTAAAFAARLKDAVDLDSVRDDLAGVVQRALEPAHISVWSASAADRERLLAGQ